MIKEGRVIRIFDDEKIAIDLGLKDGLTKGIRIAIYAKEIDIEDPESGESLGTYQHLKANARATVVAEKFTVAGPYPRREEVAVASSPAWLLGRTPTTTKTLPGELPINETEADPLPSGNEIRVGDPVFVEVEDSADADSGSSEV